MVHLNLFSSFEYLLLGLFHRNMLSLLSELDGCKRNRMFILTDKSTNRPILRFRLVHQHNNSKLPLAVRYAQKP